MTLQEQYVYEGRQEINVGASSPIPLLHVANQVRKRYDRPLQGCARLYQDGLMSQHQRCKNERDNHNLLV